MLINKFVLTRIELKELNSFLADLLDTVIITSASEKDSSPLMAFLEIENFADAHHFIDDFVKLPMGEDDDRLFIKYENMVYNALLKILKEQEELIELLCECYMLNTPFQILGLRQGIWVEING